MFHWGIINSIPIAHKKSFAIYFYYGLPGRSMKASLNYRQPVRFRIDIGLLNQKRKSTTKDFKYNNIRNGEYLDFHLFNQHFCN